LNHNENSLLDSNQVNNNDINLVQSIANLDTSSYSIQSSSCSTTPNSNYSQTNNSQANTNSRNKQYQYTNNSSKLDTDIGSACSKC
jgi:hypothetical protein